MDLVDMMIDDFSTSIVQEIQLLIALVRPRPTVHLNDDRSYDAKEDQHIYFRQQILLHESFDFYTREAMKEKTNIRFRRYRWRMEREKERRDDDRNDIDLLDLPINVLIHSVCLNITLT